MHPCQVQNERGCGDTVQRKEEAEEIVLLCSRQDCAECQNGSRQAFSWKRITSAMKTYKSRTRSATILFAERRQNNLRSKHLFRFPGKGTVSTGTDGKSPRVKDYQRLTLHHGTCRGLQSEKGQASNRHKVEPEAAEAAGLRGALCQVVSPKDLCGDILL